MENMVTIVKLIGKGDRATFEGSMKKLDSINKKLLWILILVWAFGTIKILVLLLR